MPRTARDLARVARFRLRRVARAGLSRAREVRDAGRAPRATTSTPAARSVHPGGRRRRPSVAEEFFAYVGKQADLDAAFVRAVRRMLASRQRGVARAVSQALATHPGLQVASDLCRAMVAELDAMDHTAWQLMQRNELATVLRLIPVTYVRIGLRIDRDGTVDVVRRALAGELNLVGTAATWLTIARSCFVAREEDIARAALERAGKRLRRVNDSKQGARLRRDINTLRSWLDQAHEAAAPIKCPAGEIPFAVLDNRNPDRVHTSTRVATSMESLAALGQLARRSGVTFHGDNTKLVEFADELGQAIADDRRIDGGPATVRLYRVDRDASSYSVVPDGTWLLASGFFVNTLFKMRYDLPLNPRLRPIFIGARIDVDALSGHGAVDYLKRYAPIGCRDWNTVFVLQAAGIPAFFSGPLPATLGMLVGSDPVAAARGKIYVDSPKSPVHASKVTWHDPDMARRPIGANLRDAAIRLEALRSQHREVVTADSTCYWTARAIGCAASIKLDKGPARRYDEQFGMSDKQFAVMRDSLEDKLAAVLTAIMSGKSEDDVYAVWRDVCAADVARAQTRRDELPEIDPPHFDVVAACDRIRSESVTIERSQPGPAGDEINIEFSLDGNLKHEMGVVLESIVTHTSRPIRLFVLCRDHAPEDYKRMAALFPTVSFVWLPTDHVYYGEILGMIKHITIATMDRLLLPDLLPDIDRIIHHDLDALCCADIAELFDLELGDAPLAARDQLNPNGGSAYRSFARHAAKRFRARPQLGSEFVLRQSRRHPFDQATFNAGFMVLNLARMRADGFTRYFLPFAERFGQNDQGVLNSYAASSRVPFDYAWNSYAKLEVQDDPKIIHWLGSLKPWRERFVAERDRWRAADAAFTARAKTVR